MAQLECPPPTSPVREGQPAELPASLLSLPAMEQDKAETLVIFVHCKVAGVLQVRSPGGASKRASARMHSNRSMLTPPWIGCCAVRSEWGLLD